MQFPLRPLCRVERSAPRLIFISWMATLCLRPITFSFTATVNSRTGRNSAPTPSIFLSTEPSSVDLRQLRSLLASTGQSGDRFPEIGSDGTTVAADLDKLAVALRHSFVVVSAFARRSSPLFQDDSIASASDGPLPWWEEMLPVTKSNGRLVGFGRASSDTALTAVIHDVAVLPSFQGWGIDRKIIQRIIRVLTSKGIYDISAICSNEERNLFWDCGFRDDQLESTTMMYTRGPSCSKKSDPMVMRAGKLLLLVPPQ